MVPNRATHHVYSWIAITFNNFDPYLKEGRKVSFFLFWMLNIRTFAGFENNPFPNINQTLSRKIIELQPNLAHLGTPSARYG